MKIRKYNPDELMKTLGATKGRSYGVFSGNKKDRWFFPRQTTVKNFSVDEATNAPTWELAMLVRDIAYAHDLMNPQDFGFALSGEVQAISPVMLPTGLCSVACLHADQEQIMRAVWRAIQIKQKSK